MEKEVTQKTFHGIDCCPDSGEPLANLLEAVRYMEDIVRAVEKVLASVAVSE